MSPATTVQVLLTGEVPSAQDRAQVEQIVAGVDNVRHIINELAVLGNSTFNQRSSDAWYPGVSKASLVDAQDLSANAFKIVTERGTVYVMGRVTRAKTRHGSDCWRLWCAAGGAHSGSGDRRRAGPHGDTTGQDDGGQAR